MDDFPRDWERRVETFETLSVQPWTEGLHQAGEERWNTREEWTDETLEFLIDGMVLSQTIYDVLKQMQQDWSAEEA